jgi:glyoxylate/hydroxypyruvate reductase A
MGKVVAKTLSALDYNVSVWAASPREIAEYDYYFGDKGLMDFANGLDVIICLLPLTKKTENILNRDLMSRLKQGGCVMNFGRGGHLVDEDLFRLIEEGHISEAYLDGYREEPLPSTSPFFSQDKVIVTFHSAGYISPDIGPKVIADNIQRFDRGEKVWPMYDRSKGF